MTAIQRPFKYTNRDFDSLVIDLRSRMAQYIPEWTNYDAGFETILIEAYAYVGDILNFYVDRMGNEAFLTTAVLRESVLNIAQMMGYTPAPQTASSCTVQFTKTAAALGIDVTVSAGTQLFAQVEGQTPVFFETATSLLIAAASASGAVTAVEGITENGVLDPTTNAYWGELLGSSDGSEQQNFILHYPNVVRDSVHVYTQDGSTTAPFVEWTYFPKIIDAQFYDRAFTLFTDEDNFTYIVFGDGTSGLIPSVHTNIFSTYRHGAGSKGNVGIGAVRSFVSGGALTTSIAGVTNTTAATGGTDPESVESMRTSIPRSLATIERAVSTADYAALATRVPGVAKANAAATVSTSVTLYVAPTGGGAPSTNLKNAVNAYFTGPPSRAMIGTTVTVTDPTYVPISVTLSVTVNPRYRQDAVSNAVKAAITNLLAFSVQSFANYLMKAEVFREVVDLAGVDYVDITVFSRTGAGTADVQLAANEIASVGTLVVNATGGVVIS